MNHSTIQRRRLLQAGIAGLSLPAWSFSAFAAEKYPARPVKLIVPWPAGGAMDISARQLTAVMQPAFGQTFVIDNKPGGAFVIGMNAVAQSPADGYTLVSINAAVLSAQAAYKSFDIFKTLTPVVCMGETDVTLCVSGKTPFKSVKELIDHGRANPGKLTYASPGLGTLEHLALSNFCKRYGIDAVHVPVKGGPDVIKALVQGEVEFGTLAVPLLLNMGQQTKVRPLVLFDDTRNHALPAVPTYKEEKLDVARLVVWAGLAAPAGTPPAVLDQLEKAALEALKNPELQKQYTAAGITVKPQTRAEFAATWRQDFAWIAKAASEAKLES